MQLREITSTTSRDQFRKTAIKVSLEGVRDYSSEHLLEPISTSSVKCFNPFLLSSTNPDVTSYKILL